MPDASERDVPSPIDFHRREEARAWAEAAMEKRPGRGKLFALFAAELGSAQPEVRRVLELGSGPGFLAAHLLGALPELSLTLLDFSAAMHELAAERLGPAARRARFVERDLREPGWAEGLGPFDAVVTLQAVHELRHKRRAPGLHRAVAGLLAPGGLYLVGDHFCGPGGMEDARLYMSLPEQREALEGAGFEGVTELARVGTLVLHRAHRTAA